MSNGSWAGDSSIRWKEGDIFDPNGHFYIHERNEKGQVVKRLMTDEEIAQARKEGKIP